jgi:hypothetical protein
MSQQEHLPWAPALKLQQAICTSRLLSCLAHGSLKHSKQTMCDQLLQTASHGHSSTNSSVSHLQTAARFLSHWSASRAQQPDYVSSQATAMTRLPSRRSLKQRRQQAISHQQAAGLPHGSAQAQQQAMYHRLVDASHGSRNDRANVPQATWTPSHRSLKHSNRLCTSRLPWSCLTRVISKHSNGQMAANRATARLHTGRSSTATGYNRQATLGCLTQVAQAQQQAMYQQATLSCLHGSSDSNRLMCQQTTADCLTRVAQAQQPVCTSKYLELPHTVAQAQQQGY